MDAIELARQRAAACHETAVSNGIDPWDSVALASFVAASHGFDVEPVSPGSPLLAGGRAQFDAAERAIRYEDRGSDFDRAFLIGHEIGHALLGDDPGEHIAVAVDPARPFEASPVGEERVIDYSRRQRREIQMDLFARELVLPRAVARRLHLAGMTATEMSSRIGAPHEVVAQQLLDALLLPAAASSPPPPASAPAARPLNPEQAQAASHRGGPYLLEAGPGTGKTQTLVGRVSSLLEEGVDPRSILVLTFSNKAAGELIERIAAAHPADAPALSIGTFHAFGLDMVRRLHREMGFPSEPRLMDRSEAIDRLEQRYLSLNLVHHRELWNPASRLSDMLPAIGRAKDEVADAERFARLAAAMIDGALDVDGLAAGERCAEVARVFELYEEIKRRVCAVDFGDLVALPVMLLDARPDIAGQMRRRYSQVLVDEYQDVNRSSVRLLGHLTDGGRGLWAVGDARQAIYRFRGASSFNMARFATDDFPGAEKGRLVLNYRSTPEIVSAFSTFATTMAANGKGGKLEAQRASNRSPPRHVTFGDGDDEADALADEIRVLIPVAGFRGQAVLCPGNDRLARLGRELEARGIPVLHLGNIFDRPEVKDLLFLLTLLIDRRATALVRKPSLAGLPAGPTLAGAASIIDYLRTTNAVPMSWAADLSVMPLGEDDAAAAARVAELLDGFTPNVHPWIVLTHILLDRSRVLALLSDAEDVASRATGVAIWQLMGFLRSPSQGPGLPIQRLLDRIRRMVTLADERDLRQLPQAAQSIDAVRLMTIHGSKGLEFTAVHVMGLNAGSMPTAWRPPACPVPDGMIEGGSVGTLALAAEDHRLEQECLFYVALSRARDHLLLYSASRDAGGRRRNPSSFIARAGSPEGKTAAHRADKPVDLELTPLPISLSRPIAISTAQLDLYVRCPRRFLYTHVLQTGGRRTATTLSEMHDVVREVIVSLAAMGPDEHHPAIVEAMFDAAWAAGPLADADHEPHRVVAALIVRRFAALRASATRVDPSEMAAPLDGGVIVAKADDIVTTAAGTTIVRVVRTGHRSAKSGQSLGDAAFQIAAAASLPGCAIELLHLSDDHPSVDVAFDTRALGKQREKLAAALFAIGEGRFEPNRSDRVCPSCPAYFYCGKVASGSLEKNLRA